MSEKKAKYITHFVVEKRDGTPLPDPEKLPKYLYSNDNITMPSELPSFMSWLRDQILEHLRKRDFAGIHPSATKGLVDDLQYWLQQTLTNAQNEQGKKIKKQEALLFCREIIKFIDRIPSKQIYNPELYIPFCTLAYKTAKELQA